MTRCGGLLVPQQLARSKVLTLEAMTNELAGFSRTYEQLEELAMAPGIHGHQQRQMEAIVIPEELRNSLQFENLLQFLHIAHSCCEYSICRRYLMLHTNLGKTYRNSISLLPNLKGNDFRPTYRTSISFIRQTACQESPGS